MILEPRDRQRCDVCGEPAEFAWHGRRKINLCAGCVIIALGGLLADVIAQQARPRRMRVKDLATWRIEELKARLYRALLTHAARRRRRR